MFSYSNKLRVIYMKLLEWKTLRDKGNNSMFYYFSTKQHIEGKKQNRLRVYRITNKMLVEK